MNISIYAIPGIRSNCIHLFVKRPTPNQITHIKCTTADHFCTTVAAIESKHRKQEVVLARHTCMYILKQFTGLSLKTIGEIMGDRDHTTVIHGVRQFQNHLDTEPELKVEYTRLLEKISPGLSPNVQIETSRF